jgi:hypothetical protein
VELSGNMKKSRIRVSEKDFLALHRKLIEKEVGGCNIGGHALDYGSIQIWHDGGVTHDKKTAGMVAWPQVLTEFYRPIPKLVTDKYTVEVVRSINDQPLERSDLFCALEKAFPHVKIESIKEASGKQ